MNGVTMRKKTGLWGFFALMVALLLAGCAQQDTSLATPSLGTDTSQDAAPAMPSSYTAISQDEARRMMEEESSALIVDVRRPDEFASGHIPHAINVPNEEIGTTQPKALPELDQILLVYCRTGHRSKDAAQKLANMGYTRVYEFGGINNWTGDVVT